MITIIESGSNAWAVAAADGDLRVYSRDGAGEWSEVSLSEDSEQIDQDGSLILEAVYEQHVGLAPDEETDQPEAEAEEEDEDPEEEEEIEEDQEPEAEEEEEEPEEEEEETEEEGQKPRRRRARTTASRGRAKAKAK